MRIKCNSCEHSGCTVLLTRSPKHIRTCNLDGHCLDNDNTNCPMMTKVPTLEEFKQEMQNIIQNENYEYEHNAADDYLCDVLSTLGYEKGVQIFKDMEKWYA